MKSVLFNKLNYMLQVGKSRMFIPDFSSKEYIIFEDLAGLLDLETNQRRSYIQLGQVKRAIQKDRGTIKYTSKQAVVVLNKKGKVVTTFARGTKYTRKGKK